MSGGDTYMQEQIDMDEQSICQKTLRLARLIGLDHASDGPRGWRRDLPHHSVPWRPYERAADLVPIRCWLDGRYPDWRWDYSQSSVIGTLTLPTRNHTYCGAGYGWPENVAFCNAVLEACDAPTPEPSSWTCGCASGWQAATSELHPVGTAARHRSQIQRLSRLRRAARRLAKRKVAKASGRGETIRRLLKELQTSSYAKDWACEEVAKHQGEISRLRFQLQRATADAETYLRIGRERGEKIDKLTDILQRLYDYHDAPAKYTAEYMEAVAEARDILAECRKAAERGEG